MEGKRKVYIIWSVLVTTILIVFFGLYYSVGFTGDNLQAILVGLFIFAGAMAGANVGEHFAKARLNGK